MSVPSGGVLYGGVPIPRKEPGTGGRNVVSFNVMS